MRKAKHNLTEGPVGHHIKRLTLAMGWGIVAMNIVQFTDMWFISRLGHQQLTAISFTLPVTTFLFFMVLAMSSGMTSASARAAGGMRPEHAARTVTAGLLASGVIGIVMSAVAFALKDIMFRAMGAPADMIALIDAFMNIWLLCIPFMAMCIVANSGTRGSGEGALPAYVMIFLALTNLVLDPIFIFGLDMGMRGAALATLLAYISATVAAVTIAARKMHLIKFSTLRNIRKTRKALKTWLQVVLPVSIAYAIEPFSAGVLTAGVAHIGLDAVAAYGVATRVEGIALIMLMALWGAVTPLAGQNWAAGKRDRVRRTIDIASIVNGAFCILFAGVMWIFAERVAGWFSAEPRTVALAAIYLSIVPISYVGFGASGLIGSALNGIGRAHWYLVANGARVLLLVAFAVYGAHAHGFFGFAVGVGAANLLAGGAIVAWSRRVFLASRPVSSLSEGPTFP